MAVVKTRDVAKAAVRVELGQAALALFLEKGFDRVTINDVAAATGVSRTTFLRYFATKEDAVLGAFEERGEDVARALGVRPPWEDDWTALRRAFDLVVEDHERDRTGALAITRLVRETPSLRAWELRQQCGWRVALASALADRAHHANRTRMRPLILVAAALDCLDIAVSEWAASDPDQRLGSVLDAAFAQLTVPRTTAPRGESTSPASRGEMST